MKGFEMATFSISSPNFYESGNFHFLCRSPLPFLSLLKYFGTQSSANCISSGKIKIELGNINGLELDDALSLYEDMAKMRPLPIVTQFNQLLSRVVKNVVPDVIVYNALICGLCNLSRWKQVKKLFEEMVDCKLYPDVVTFGTIIDALCKEGLVDEAEDVFHIMKQKNVVPNVIAYNALMDGYCLQGRVGEARDVFYSMANKKICPDVYSYNILISGYCRKMKIEDAMHLFHEMPRKGLKPDVVAYASLLQGLFRGGRCSSALKLFDEFRASGLKPDFHTYCNLLDGLCMNGHAERALLLLETLEQNGESLHIEYYNIVIHGFCRAKKDLPTARDVLNGLPCKGLEPNVVTYNILIKGCSQNGLLEEARDLLLKMEHESNLSPDEYTYNRGILMKGEYDDASKFLEEMVARGFSPDSSIFEALLRSVRNKEQNPTAFKMLKKFAPSILK